MAPRSFSQASGRRVREGSTGSPAARSTGLGHGLVHRYGGGGAPRAHEGRLRQLEQPLEGAVLPEGAVNHGEEHVDAYLLAARGAPKPPPVRRAGEENLAALVRVRLRMRQDAPRARSRDEDGEDVVFPGVQLRHDGAARGQAHLVLGGASAEQHADARFRGRHGGASFVGRLPGGRMGQRISFERNLKSSVPATRSRSNSACSVVVGAAPARSRAASPVRQFSFEREHRASAHRVNNEAVFQQVERRLIAADVRLRPGEQNFRSAGGAQAGQEPLRPAAAEREFLHRREAGDFRGNLRHRGPESFGVLLGDERRKAEARRRLRQRPDASDDLRANAPAHGGHELLLRVDDE